MSFCAAWKAREPAFTNLDEMSDEELKAVQGEFARLRDKYAPLVDDDLAHVEHQLQRRALKKAH